MNWQPIETAPKDAHILVIGALEQHPHLRVSYPASLIVVAHWDTIDERFCLTGGDWLGPFISPTHWMPLPPPPTE